jgi:hypothetical protein
MTLVFAWTISSLLVMFAIEYLRGIEEGTRQFASAGLGFFLDAGKVDANALS